MGAARVLQPTRRGAAIRAICDATCGSIRAASVKAGVSEAALRRWIYGEPTRASRAFVDKLEAIGVPRVLFI